MMIDGTRLTIRPITAEDISPLARVLGRNEHSISRLWSDETPGWHEMLVACLDDSPVGSVNVDVKEELPGYAHLFALGVGQEFQRRGIGSRLIARIEAEAAARSYDGVFLNVGIDNHDARRLYERLGYAAEGERFEIGWERLNEDGTGERVTETVHRMFKRFTAAKGLG